MTTAAAIGFGVTFSIYDTSISPDAYVALGEVLNVDGPSMSRDMIDATHTGSTSRWREFVSGLRDGGEVSVEMNLDPDGSTYLLLFNEMESDTKKNHKITFPDTSTWSFSGLITGLESSQPVDDKMVVTATFKVDGQPALTQAA